MTDCDTWKSWIDDLPLDGFDEGKAGLQEFITQLEAERADAMALFHAADKLVAERDTLRAAIFGSADYDRALTTGNFVEMAKMTEAARLGALSRAKQAEAERDAALAGAVRVKPLVWGPMRVSGFEAYDPIFAEPAFASDMAELFKIDADRDARIRAALEPDPEREAKVQALIDVVDTLMRVFPDPCRYDHHGKCQEHFIEDKCSVAGVKAALKGLTS